MLGPRLLKLVAGFVLLLCLAGVVAWWSWSGWLQVEQVDTELDAEVVAIGLADHVQVGERLIYSFHVGSMDTRQGEEIGRGEWRVTDRTATTVQAEFLVRSGGLVTPIFPVQDRFSTTVDLQAGWTEAYSTDISEGGYAKRERFSRHDGQWRYERTRERDGVWVVDEPRPLAAVPSAVCDPLAALLRLRALEPTGQRIPLLDRSGPTELHILAVEPLTWQGAIGSRQALSLRLALFRQSEQGTERVASEDLLVVIDAMTRVPLRIQLGGIPVLGTVTAELVCCEQLSGW